MQYDKIIKREDGTKVQIHLSVWLNGNEGAVYGIWISVCPPGKRKFFHVDRDDYQFRSLSMGERVRAMQDEFLKYLTKDEIHNAKMELWELMKPTK